MAEVDHFGGDVAEAVDAEQFAVVGAEDQLQQSSVSGDRPAGVAARSQRPTT